MERNWESLVRRAQENDQDAWSELHRVTEREAYFVALKVLGNEQDAVDIVQDAYLIAFQRLDQLEDPQKFRSWFNMIVANSCRNYLKKRKPMLFSELESEDGPSIDWADAREDAIPEQKVDHEETVRLVAEMIENLPEDQRLCVLLYYKENLGVSEIAKALLVSDGTVKSRLNYARKKIKANVEQLEKQGTKLYGLAPIPLLLWALRSEAEAMALPEILAAGSSAAFGGAATVTATGGTASSAAATGGIKAAAAGSAKVLVGSTVTKVVAGCLAAAVLVGGVSQLARQTSPAEGSVSIGHVSTTDSEGNPVSGKTDETSGEAEAEKAYQAYAALLDRGYTDSRLTIRYFAYLDLDQDGIPEILCANNTGEAGVWTSAELYKYSNGQARLIRLFDTEEESFYLVNDCYILCKCCKNEDWFWGLDDGFGVGTDCWNFDTNQKEARLYYEDGSHRVLTTAEVAYFTFDPVQEDHTFAETAEKIVLEANTAGLQCVRMSETPWFDVPIPQTWIGRSHIYTKITEVGSELYVYEGESFQAGEDICVLSVKTIPLNEEMSPEGIELGTSSTNGIALRVVAEHAGGPLSDNTPQMIQETYDMMLRDLDWVLENIKVK